MMVDRRHWMGLIALVGGTAVAARAVAARPRRRQVIHHVFFWLKHPESQADVDRLVAGLETLRSIPQVRELRIGRPASTEQRAVVDNSYSVSELIVFDNVADQAAYQDHPIHRRFVAACETLWDRVVVYDAIDV